MERREQFASACETSQENLSLCVGGLLQICDAVLSVLQEMNMMCVPFVWMNMRMETSSESFHVLMVSSCALALVFVLKELSTKHI